MHRWLTGFLALAASFAALGGAIEKDAGFNGEGFEYACEELEATPEYRLFRLSYPSPEPPSWPEAEQVAAYYYRPAGWQPGDAPRPGVVCLHILGGDGELTRMLAANFAAHGIPAIMPVFPLFGERVPAGGRNAAVAGPRGARIIGESFRAMPGEVRRTADILQSFPEVDPGRLNIMGTSLGGIMAATAAGQDRRFGKAVFLLAGGDLERILATDVREINPIREALARAPEEDRNFMLEVMRQVDPLTWADRVEAEVLMFNAAEDEVIVRESTMRLAQALGVADRVEFAPGLGHYSAVAMLPELMQTMVAFFGDGTAAEPPQGTLTPDREVIKGVFAELQKMVSGRPAPGCDMLLACRVDAVAEGRNYAGEFRFVRGEGERFSLIAAVEGEFFKGLKIDRIACGIGEYPWLVSAREVVFAGSGEPGGGGVFAAGLDDKPGRFSLMAGSVAGMVAMTGDLGPLSRWVDISLENRPGAAPKILIRERKVSAEIELDAAGTRPALIRIDAGKWSAEIRVTEWDTAALHDPERFEPPSGIPVKTVPGYQLARTLAAMVNFALKGVELK